MSDHRMTDPAVGSDASGRAEGTKADEGPRLPHLFGEQTEVAGETNSSEPEEADNPRGGEGGPDHVESEQVAQEEPEQGKVSAAVGAAARRRGRVLSKADRGVTRQRVSLSCEQRLLILDSWMRSKLPASDFAPLVGVSMHTLYEWKKKFNELGPAGLADRPRGTPEGSRMAEPTRRAVLMMKQAHPEWGCERLHDMLMRTQGYAASSGAIANLLKQEGYESQNEPTRPHPDKVRSFERSRPNQMWQTDLFTFVLKRENRRVHMVAFMDDHSRYVVGYGLHASASGALVREVMEAAIANFGSPEEVLSDNGTQYHTWRGKSAFTSLLERRGIKHIVAHPRHPQTLGKVERFWGTLWRECVELAIFQGLDDARRRVGLFIDYYNFQRTHSGIEGMVPADRYFSAAPEVLEALKGRVTTNALELARGGLPRKSFYLAGRVGEQSIALHAEGSSVILTREDGSREEVNLEATGRRSAPGETSVVPEPVATHVVMRPTVGTQPDGQEWAPGASPLDGVLERLGSSGPDEGGEV